MGTFVDPAKMSESFYPFPSPNLFHGNGIREGKEIGLMLRFTHHTLQGLAMCFAFGLIAGLSEQEFTDPRNETAIQSSNDCLLAEL
jgi:hypothetical protein